MKNLVQPHKLYILLSKIWSCLFIFSAFGACAQEQPAVQNSSSEIKIEPTFSCEEFVKKAWSLQGKNDTDGVFATIDECISAYGKEAQAQAASLTAAPLKEETEKYSIMNNVATCYYIKGETLRSMSQVAFDKEDVKKLQDQAIASLEELIKKYPYAQQFDPRGWYWSLAEKAAKIIDEIKKGDACEVVENKLVETTKITLHDKGLEFPVNYTQYGTFENVGTKDYKYTITDFPGLTKAVGEGIYPNSASMKTDPAYLELKKLLPTLDHWALLNSRDLKTAFYKWSMAPEPQGVKQFYVADILERAGLLEHAIKAYYSILVHNPNSYGWTYWHTPWYPAKVSLYRINYILKNNPQLGLALEGASATIINGSDNDINNDTYLINPGKLVKSNKYSLPEKKRDFIKVTKSIGLGRSKLVQYDNSDWQMLVDDKPFTLHGITYAPTRVSESPDKNTLIDWTKQDLNKNGLIDAPYESWVDTNKNNTQDADEPVTGDFQLLKEMGVNCLRLYHQPFKHDKNALRAMNEKYGIFVAMGDFLGKYTQGSKADWSTGTDYDNPEHCKNMLASVKEMVDEYKDEPYVIMWIIGNENVYGLGCNADKKPESFFKFANETAKYIKSIDPMQRPILIASGDTLFLNVFAKECPDVDIFGANLYRGAHGFLDYWDEVKAIANKPAIVTEFGVPAYGDGYTLEEAEEYQAKYHETCWKDLSGNTSGHGAGNAIGSFAFEWLDEWWKAYNPKCHDTAKLSAGPFLDGYYREEWFGIVSQGDGLHSPFMRQLRKAYFVYKKIWNQN